MLSLLLLLLGPGSVSGVLVSQKPSRGIFQHGTSVTIQCQVDTQVTSNFWYYQPPGQGLTLIATANQGSDATYESGFTKDKFPISRPDLTFSNLTVKNSSPEDSGIYFCSVDSQCWMWTQELGKNPTSALCLVSSSQKSSRDICQQGTSVMMQCQVESQVAYMFWYQQRPGQSLTLIASVNQGSDASYESGFTKDKFPISHSDLTFSTLIVSNGIPEDSGIYLCSVVAQCWAWTPGLGENPMPLPSPPYKPTDHKDCDTPVCMYAAESACGLSGKRFAWEWESPVP